jgi:RHS repeat-associated protein
VKAAMKYLGDGKLAELDSAGTSHRYLIDPTTSGNRILAELDTTGAMQIGYVYGPRGMISQIPGGQTYAYFHNLQGSTVVLVDSTGTLKNSYLYDPFGQKLSSTIEQVGNSFAFLGRYSTPTVGQYSLTAHRVYDSLQGRFTGVDPLMSAPQSVSSAFVYARQAPLGMIDPTGLIAVSVDASDALDKISQLASAAAHMLSPTVASAGPGAFQFVDLGARDILDTSTRSLSVVQLAVELNQDLNSPNANLASIRSTTGQAAGCAVLDEIAPGGCLVFTLSFAAGRLAYEQVPVVSSAANSAVASLSVPSAGETILSNGDCYVGTAYCGNVNFLAGPAASASNPNATQPSALQSPLPIQPRGGK